MKIINMTPNPITITRIGQPPLDVEPSDTQGYVGVASCTDATISGIMICRDVDLMPVFGTLTHEVGEFPDEADDTIIVVSQFAYIALQDGGYLESRRDVFCPSSSTFVGDRVVVDGLMQGIRR